ncbi:hypothetical protein ACFQ60_22880 [Streptomyces zhihengii]
MSHEGLTDGRAQERLATELQELLLDLVRAAREKGADDPLPPVRDGLLAPFPVPATERELRRQLSDSYRRLAKQVPHPEDGPGAALAEALLDSAFRTRPLGFRHRGAGLLPRRRTPARRTRHRDARADDRRGRRRADGARDRVRGRPGGHEGRGRRRGRAWAAGRPAGAGAGSARGRARHGGGCGGRTCGCGRRSAGCRAGCGRGRPAPGPAGGGRRPPSCGAGCWCCRRWP